MFWQLIFAALPLALGGLSGWLSGTGQSAWYKSLKKPSWNPPAYVFAPVWTTLYILMGIASIPAFNQRDAPALAVFLANLMLNVSWPLVFFRAQRPDLALAIIIALWISIIATMVLFARITKLWILLIPYALWVTYATTLNASIVALNKKNK